MITNFFIGEIQNQQPEKSAALAALEHKLRQIETDCLLSLPLALPYVTAMTATEDVTGETSRAIVDGLARVETEEFYAQDGSVGCD